MSLPSFGSTLFPSTTVGEVTVVVERAEEWDGGEAIANEFYKRQREIYEKRENYDDQEIYED